MLLRSIIFQSKICLNFEIIFDRDFKDEEKFRLHFEKFGKVVEAKLVRNFMGTLQDHKALGILHQAIVEERKKVEKFKLSFREYRLNTCQIGPKTR